MTTLPPTTFAPTTCIPDIDSSDFTEVGALAKWTEVWNGADFNLSIIAAANEARVGTSDLFWDSINIVASRRFASFDPPGECKNVEILTLVNAPDIYTPGQSFRLCARASGSVGSETCYFVNYLTASVTFSKYVAGAATTIDTKVYDASANDKPLWLRFRVNGTSLKLKIWPYNSYEPVEWGFSVTDSSITGAGKLGIGQYAAKDFDVMYFAAGVGGSSPSVPALTTGTKDRLRPKYMPATPSSVDWTRFFPFRIITAANSKYLHAIKVYFNTEYDNVRIGIYKGSDAADITDATLIEDLGKPALAVGWNQFSLSSPCLQVSTGDIIYVGLKSDGPSLSAIIYTDSPLTGNAQVSNASGRWQVTAGMSSSEDVAYPINLAGITAAQADFWYGVEILLQDSPITTAVPTTLIPTTSAPTTAGPTVVPTTVAPTTLAPTSLAPTTLAPTTSAPTSLPPTTLPSTTLAPTTIAPTSLPPTTLAPTTLKPTTLPPTTLAPTSLAPTTLPPTTLLPTTLAPTTLTPTTVVPTTLQPTTLAPTTLQPTTFAPTTIAPTTLPPTTLGPTTLGPTTIPPTTLAPTTNLPEEICVKELSSTIINEITLTSKITKEMKINGNLC